MPRLGSTAFTRKYESQYSSSIGTYSAVIVTGSVPGRRAAITARTTTASRQRLRMNDERRMPTRPSIIITTGSSNTTPIASSVIRTKWM